MEASGKETSYDMFSTPAILGTFADVMVQTVPFWSAIVIGLVVGWFWRPRWVSFLVLALRTRPRLLWSTPPGFGARRVWLALTAITAFPFLKDAWTKFHSWMWPDAPLHTDDVQCGGDTKEDTKGFVVDGGGKYPDDRGGKGWALTTEDLVYLYKKVECQDGGAQWNHMMDRAVQGLTYQCWRREPLDGVGPTEYRSRTYIDDCTPELMRDFFWDDDFRRHWDDMLIYSKTWEDCPRTGAMLVQWVRKFPVFCKDREYTVSRRIWAVDSTYYCVTKAVQYPQVPRQSTPRRVDNYFSSWCIRPAASRNGAGLQTACEIWLFHDEDMGIQRDLAKLGIRQGMWGCVKKMVPGLKLYKEVRQKGEPLSKSAQMAHVITKVSPNFFQTLALPEAPESDGTLVTEEKPAKAGYLRWFVIGGAVALACGVDKGAVGKVLIFGLARRLGKTNRKSRVRF